MSPDGAALDALVQAAGREPRNRAATLARQRAAATDEADQRPRLDQPWVLDLAGLAPEQPASSAPPAAGAASATPPPLAAQWRHLHAALHAPAAVLPADAARCFTLYLAALADWHQAAPADSGLPARLALLLAAFEGALDAPGPVPPAKAGIAGRFLHEALALRDLCVVLDADLAAQHLAPRLAQDWAQLPADFAAALRRRCLERAGTRLMAELLAALLMQGTASRRRTREIAARYPPGDLDGIALGPRAPANAAIEQIAQVLELRLGQRAPGA
ncbi:hypothetical protein [uncultured Thiohalocapsa sp.]|uniref:hypothetical protein n=1 Tax=uncultured Thiohalocapsa sp. TaxID=768990 RepID=UPI0025EFB10A|nr:hypothetical protein [uncultured Thiohalocapsa sp.]